MRFILPVLLASAALAGCYDRNDAKPQSAPEPQAAATLGGVDLGKPVRALGTEPFWGVEITPDALIYTRVDQPTQRAPNRGATVQGTVANFASSTDLNQALNVVLIATECSDGMSDRTYPLTAKVEIGDDTLTGCAAPASMLTAQPAP
ncbi:COG3650 family protein [Brevundimonas sp. TWP1-2-1b1]|uniref:COG3650 family protein n=1 Tax=unclassified Brevundimonas TaxID=2622653 RepID=UPI003CEEC7A7